jgi:acetyl esterase/lipase
MAAYPRGRLDVAVLSDPRRGDRGKTGVCGCSTRSTMAAEPDPPQQTSSIAHEDHTLEAGKPMPHSARFVALTLGLALATALPGIAQEREPIRRLTDLAYVPDGHPRQKLDLYLPPAGKDHPLIVWIHGGAWSGGDKRGGPALRFVERGDAVASVNYRLSSDAPFPAQIEDCKAAIRWLRAHAAEYGYSPDRIGVWGSSAGGHLVALLGTSSDVEEFDVGPNRDVSSRVQAVCDFYGPADLLRMGAQSGPESRIDHDAADSPESRLVGGPIQERKELATKASPITYVSKERARRIPPFLILHGDRDDTVPIGQSERLHQALRAAGVASEYHVVEGAGHGGGSFNGPEVQRRVDHFFAEHLGREAAEGTTPTDDQERTRR